MLGRLLKNSEAHAPASYQLFQQARDIYDRYAQSVGLELLGPTREQQEQVRDHAGLAQAAELYQQSLRLCLQEGEEYNAAVVRHQLGLLKRLQGRFEEAVPCFEQALDGFRQSIGAKRNARSDLGVCHFYLGQAHLKAGDKRRARQHLESAIAVDEAIQDERRVDAAKTMLAECGEPVSAEEPNLSSIPPSLPVNEQTPKTAEGEAGESLVPLSSPATIWVVAQTDAARQATINIVREALAGLRGPFVVVDTALDGVAADGRPLGRPKGDPGLSAVVLIIEPSSLTDPSFLSLVQWSITEVATRDGFRLFPCLSGMGADDFEMEVNSGNEVLKRLVDTVQVEGTASPEALRRNLRAYLAHLQEIRNAGAWLRLRLTFSVLLGHFAAGLQILCVPVGAALVLWLPLWDTRATLRQFGGWEHWAALVCGVASFPFLMMGLFAYTRYGTFLYKMMRDPFGFLWGFAFTFVGAPIFLSSVRIKAPVAWIVLGVVLGAMLDGARRAGLRAKRERRPVDPQSVARKHGRLPKHLREQAGPAWLNPLRCPLFPARTPKVFISYTRSSAWARRVAGSLAKYLSGMKVRAFLDQQDIPAGVSWRRALNHHLSRATAFVCLADSQSVERVWPAAEMEAALAGKHLIGLPQIIVLKEPNLPYAGKDTWSWLPAFRETVKSNGGSVAEGQPRVFVYSEAEPLAVAYAFHPDEFKSVSVFPAGLADLLHIAWTKVSALLLLLQSPAERVARFPILLLIAEAVPGVNSARWLSAAGLLPLVFLVVASLVGSFARWAVAARFQMRRERAAEAFCFYRDVAAIYFALLVVWGGREAPALLIGWAVVACVLGWSVADGFCERESRRDPQFLWSED